MTEARVSYVTEMGVQIGDRLRELRLAAGLTQERLADRAGMPRVSINRIENNREQVGRRRIERLAAVLDVTPLDLGAPETDEPAAYLSIDRRLEELEGELAALRRRHERFVRAASRRLAELEAAQQPQARQAARQPKG